MPSDPPAAPRQGRPEDKRALREYVLRARDTLDPATRARASRLIVEGLWRLEALRGARRPLLTLPFRSEWDTRPLVLRALEAGMEVALPRVDAATRALALHRIGDLAADTVAGYRDIPEPRAALPQIAPSTVDVVLVPGVAFDAAGRRLGYGGGYYDRLLRDLEATVPRIAGAFDEQVIDCVPAVDHDQRVDFVVTPTRCLAARARP